MPFDSMTWICYIVYLKRYFSYLIAANLGPSQTLFKLTYMSLITPNTFQLQSKHVFFFTSLISNCYFFISIQVYRQVSLLKAKQKP